MLSARTTNAKPESHLAVTAFAASVHLNTGGGAFMQRSIFAGLFLVSLLIASGGGAQTPSDDEKPVWTMESIKVKPGMFDFTLSYLDDHWMRVREEAKRQGAVLSYHRVVEQDSRESERNIVLLTEYKNHAAYDDVREKLLALTRKGSENNFVFAGHQFLIPGAQAEQLYETMNTRVFQEYSETGNVRVQPLASH